MSPTFRSLRVRNFRLFTAGMFVSNIGTWMQRVAQDWLVLDLSDGNGAVLGVTTGLQFLPMLLFGMWGGLIADRFPKRRVLLATQVLMGVTALILGLLTLAGAVEVWHVYVLAFLLGTVTAVDNPTRQSFVLEMVERDDLPNAVGLNSASFNAARIVGPGAAGLLISVFDTGPVFVMNAVSYAAVFAAVLLMNPAELHPSPPARRGPGMVREGFRYVWGRPDLMLVITIMFFVGTFGLNFQMTTALMAREEFHKGPGEYGLLGSVMAVGSLTGALLAARRGQPRLRLIVGAAVVFGVLEAISGLMPNYVTFLLVLPLIGVAALTLMTAANATMQLAVAPAMRGRVMALYMAVFFGGTPVGAPVVGWVAEAFGVRYSLVGGGLVSAVAALAAAAVVARRQGLDMRGRLRAIPVDQQTVDRVQSA